MKHNYSWLSILLIAIMLFIPGCSQKSKPSQKPAQQQSNQRAEIPKQFEQIVKDTESIIMQTDMKWKMKQNSTLQKSTPIEQEQGGESGQKNQGGQAGKQGSTSGNQSGSPGSQSSQGGQKQGNQGQSQKSGAQQGMTWEQETKGLMKIHENWNSLQAEALKAGMNNNMKAGFDKALDQLTIEINNQDAGGSLLAAINLFGQFTGIAQLFKGQLPPVFYDSQYEVMQVIALGQQEDWEDAQSQVITMQDQWNTLKAQAQQAKPQTISCTEIAIQDLVRAVDMNSKELVSIKGEIAVKNMKKLQEELSRKQMGGQ